MVTVTLISPLKLANGIIVKSLSFNKKSAESLFTFSISIHTLVQYCLVHRADFDKLQYS